MEGDSSITNSYAINKFQFVGVLLEVLSLQYHIDGFEIDLLMLNNTTACHFSNKNMVKYY